MEPKYTAYEMRELAGQLTTPLHPFALDRARSMLYWAADVIEAARKALEPTSEGGK